MITFLLICIALILAFANPEAVLTLLVVAFYFALGMGALGFVVLLIGVAL